MTRTLTVALLQLAAFDLADHEQAWAELLRRIDDAAADSPRLMVAPEAAYPAALLGSREAYDAARLRDDAELLAALAERARRHQCYLAAGLVLRDPGGAPRNAAVLLSPQGVELARAAEATPAPWFAPGGGALPVALDGAPAGLIAGDDARDPAQIAALAETGARLLISTGAATAWGRTADRLVEPEAHRLLAARAIEAGAWAVTPGKVGVEAASRVYAGRAGVIDPAGEWLVRAPADRPGVVLHTIDLDAVSGPPVAPRHDLRELHELHDVPAPAPRTTPAGPRHVAAIAIDPMPSAVDLIERLRALVRSVAAQGASLVVVPDLAGADARAVTSAESLPLLEALARETRTVIAVALAERSDGVTYKTAYLIDRGTTVSVHRQSHLAAGERAAGFVAGDHAPPVAVTSAGAIGLLSGVEGLVPALADGLRRRGAELIVWCAGEIGAPVETLARARAIEQRVPVVAAGAEAARGGGSIIDETGATLATTLAGRAMAAHAVLLRAR